MKLKNLRELLIRVVNKLRDSFLIGTAFYLVINMSITATFIGFLIMILRKIKRIPRWGVYSLWTLVLLRLIIPFSVSSRISIINLSKSFVKKVVNIKTLSQEGINLTFSNSIGAVDSYFPVEYKTEQLKLVFETAAFVWIVGTVGALLAVAILYFLTNNELRNSLLIKDNVYSSEMVQAPIVHGIFKQHIIIPQNYIYNTEQLKYVVLHEEVHIKRHDNLLRLIAVFTACIHWFNPFVWAFLKLFTDDMEITCDTKVIKSLSPELRKQYAQTLVNVSSRQQIFMSTAFSKSNVKVRVTNVLTYKKLSIFALAATMIFIIFLSVILFTNPVK